MLVDAQSLGYRNDAAYRFNRGLSMQFRALGNRRMALLLSDEMKEAVS
jgi:hypothetical protein